MSRQEEQKHGADNLALQVRNIFERLKKNGNDKTRLDQAWRGTFATPQGPADNALLYEALQLVAAALDRLKLQIDQCPALSLESKKIYRSIVGNLRPCIDPASLSRPFSQYRPNLDPEKLNYLTLMGDPLGQMFPQPTLTSDDCEAIRSALDELEQMIEGARISPEAQALLLHHVAFMRWVIANLDMFGFDAAYEALARTRIALHRKQDEFARSGEERQTSNRMKTIIKRLATSLDRAERGVRLAERIYELGADGSNWVSGFLPPAG